MMDYEQLKAEVKEIAEIANTVPEPLREKCFEVLLNHLLAGASDKHSGSAKGTAIAEKRALDEHELKVPGQVRVFLQRTGLGEDVLRSVITLVDGEVHFLKEPRHTSLAKGQIEWALLLALKSGVERNALVADPEAVRSVCQDKGFYDRTNFATNFKTVRSAALFKGQMDPQGEARALSADGEKRLADLIKSLAGAE